MNEEKMFELLNREYGKLVSSPRYRFWEDKNKNRFFYTIEKANHNGKSRYIAGIYRFLKTKKQWKLVKTVGFAKKFKAKDWAYKNYSKSN